MQMQQDVFLAIYSQYVPVIKVCERGTIFQFGVPFLSNCIRKRKGLDLEVEPPRIELSIARLGTELVVWYGNSYNGSNK